MTILERALRVGEGKKFKAFEKKVAASTTSSPSSSSSRTTSCASATTELRERCQSGETLDDLLLEAFALTREAGKRTLGQRHFDVQLIGGMVLHDGSIAEMRTGEGKTLTATLPIVLNALAPARERPPSGRASTWSRSTTTSPAATPSG